jgi:hypothetical protein
MRGCAHDCADVKGPALSGSLERRVKWPQFGEKLGLSGERRWGGPRRSAFAAAVQYCSRWRAVRLTRCRHAGQRRTYIGTS